MAKVTSNCTFFIIATLILLFPVSSFQAQDRLEELFRNPPEAAKPRGYWIWAHGNFDYRTITRELKAFKEMGLAGADIFDMGISDPYDIIPPGNTFMGEAMLDGIAFALQEAKKLDLQMGLSVSNGWNAGGDWTKSDEKIMRLLFWRDTIQGPIEVSQVGFPEVPMTFEKPYGQYELFPQFNADGFPEYYENVALVAFPLRADRRIRETKQIRYFDIDAMKGNKIKISLPKGKWVLARAVVTPLGQKMWVRSDNSNGFIMDHYSKRATKHHFEHIIGKLEERMGNLANSALERLYLASFEAEDYVIWSPELKEAFRAQHGYEIDPFIPAFAGWQIIDEATTECFLHDYRSTVSEMFVNNHYRQASAICRQHGILLASESGGPGVPLHYVPTEYLMALGSVYIMRGDFLNMPNRLDDKNGNNLLQVVKNIGSAAHIYGHKVVEMEAFTSQRKHWQESPFELKPLADRAFCEGMTRVVYHTMPHSPPEAGVPGWSYQAGTHIHPKMTWWPMSKPFHEYLARCGALLMEGHFVADVAYFYGSEIPNFALAKYVRPDLGPGYDYDDLNDEVLLQTTEVEDGQIVLPSGMRYHVLVLPQSGKMKLEVLQKIEELLQKGATIIGPKPDKVYGLSNYKEQEKDLRRLADRIWGSSSDSQVIDKQYGKGRIVSGKKVREVLAEQGVIPDLTYSQQGEKPVLDYIHRTTESGEIYFIRNTDSRSVYVEPSFRVKHMRPELWDPVTGERHRMAIFREEQEGIRLPLHLEAFGSVFVIFRPTIGTEEPHIESIYLENKSVFPAEKDASNPFEGFFEAGSSICFFSRQGGKYDFGLTDGRKISRAVPEEELVLELNRPWHVHFPYGWGVKPIQEFEALRDWTTFPDDNLKHFSGIATYRTTFRSETSTFPVTDHYFLDLGRVGEVATVYLNGRKVGTSLFPPHRLEVTSMLIPGENRLVVEVANTWLNRLIGDLDRPLDQQYTRSNVGSSAGTEVRPWQDRSLPPSGLLGPVRIVKRSSVEIPSN